MVNQSPLTDQLVRQRIAELHATAAQERVARGAAGLSRTRAYAGRLLIALGTRLAPTEPRASNRMTKLAGR